MNKQQTDKKKSFSIRSKRGFSFVEMSIVLVLIGLFIAAITTGDKLLESIRIKKVISELTEIQRATIFFGEQYHAIPGDMSNAYDFFSDNGCGSYSGGSGSAAGKCNGSGDLIINGSGAGGYCREEPNFWNHLYYAGLLTEGIEPSCITVYESKAIDGATVSVRHYGISTNPYFGSGVNVNYFTLGALRSDLSETQTYNNDTRILTPLQAKRIDVKLDDGLAYSGKLQGRNGYIEGSSTFSSGCSVNGIGTMTATDYQVTNNSIECRIIYKMFAVDTKF